MTAREYVLRSATLDNPIPAASNDDLQLVLAADRTMLSLERTYAAWVRTGLAALASGVAARHVVAPTVSPFLASTMASLLIVFSGFCFVAGVWRDLGRVGVVTPADLQRVPPAVLIVASAVMTSISLLALAGVWTVAR